MLQSLGALDPGHPTSIRDGRGFYFIGNVIGVDAEFGVNKNEPRGS